MDLWLVAIRAATYAAFLALLRNVVDAGMFSTALQPVRGLTGRCISSPAIRPNPQCKNDAVFQVALTIVLLA